MSDSSVTELSSESTPSIQTWGPSHGSEHAVGEDITGAGPSALQEDDMPAEEKVDHVYLRGHGLGHVAFGRAPGVEEARSRSSSAVRPTDKKGRQERTLEDGNRQCEALQKQGSLSKTHDGRPKNLHGHSPAVRDEIAMPFDAIYGLKPKPAISTSRAFLPGKKLHMQSEQSSPYSLSFPVSGQLFGKPLKRPGFYASIPSLNIDESQNISHPVYQKHAVVAPSVRYDTGPPLVIDTGRSRFLGYQMRTPPERSSQAISSQADRTAAKQRSAAPSKKKHANVAAPDVIEIDTDDDATMEVGKNKTMADTNRITDSKSLRRQDGPAGNLWSLASAAAAVAHMSSVRSTLESTESKDSAITLIRASSASGMDDAAPGGKEADA